MKKVNIKVLTLEDFKIYGSFSNMINPDTPSLGNDSIRFYRDMEILDLGQASDAAFSVTRVIKRPYIIDFVEYHMNSGEGVIPLDGDILMYVGLATPNGEIPVNKLEVFRVPKGTFVSIRQGVWHGAPFAYGTEYVNILNVLPERAYAKDCLFHTIAEEENIEIDVE